MLHFGSQRDGVSLCTSARFVRGFSVSLFSKTTVIMYKMVALEMTWLQNADVLDAVKQRQMFVTRSQLLADKVKEAFGRHFGAHVLGEEFDTTGNGEDDLLRDEEDAARDANLPRRLSELTDEHFPLFISFDRVRDSVVEVI